MGEGAGRHVLKDVLKDVLKVGLHGDVVARSRGGLHTPKDNDMALRGEGQFTPGKDFHDRESSCPEKNAETRGAPLAVMRAGHGFQVSRDIPRALPASAAVFAVVADAGEFPVARSAAVSAFHHALDA